MSELIFTSLFMFFFFHMWQKWASIEKIINTKTAFPSGLSLYDAVTRGSCPEGEYQSHKQP